MAVLTYHVLLVNPMRVDRVHEGQHAQASADGVGHLLHARIGYYHPYCKSMSLNHQPIQHDKQSIGI